MRGVNFRILISPRIRSQNLNSLKGSVRNLGQSDLCKNIGKTGSLPCPFKKNAIFVCVSGKLFRGHFPRIREYKRREIIVLQFRPFWPFLFKIGQKNRPQNCPAASLFIQPYLTYAAEKSASWQQCRLVTEVLK
jgi:hypothetical protein